MILTTLGIMVNVKPSMSWWGEDEDRTVPPYDVGECVEYRGRNSWQKGGGPEVRFGDIGVVVQNIPAEERKEGVDYNYERDPLPAFSVVEFHGSRGARQRVRHSSDYWRVECPESREGQAQ